MKAAEQGSTEFCEILLLQGANPMIEDNFGRNALSHATSNGNAPIIEILNIYIYMLEQ